MAAFDGSLTGVRDFAVLGRDANLAGRVFRVTLRKAPRGPYRPLFSGLAEAFWPNLRVTCRRRLNTAPLPAVEI